MKIKSKTLKPLLTPLNDRDQCDVLPAGSPRIKINWSVRDGSLVRSEGWQRLLNQVPYCNQDLHDQLLGMQFHYDENTPATANSDAVVAWPSASCDSVRQMWATGRQPITLVSEVETDYGGRILIAATQSRIYCLNVTTGNWRLLANGIGPIEAGGFASRFKMAHLNDVMLFTNNFDRPHVWVNDTLPHGCKMRAIDTVEEMNRIGLYRARDVVSHKGYLMCGNIDLGGSNYAGGLIWCYAGKPFAWARISQDHSNFQDLVNHSIMGFAEAGDWIIVITNRGLWRGAVTGRVESAFQFGLNYEAKGQLDKCCAFANTIVSVGQGAFYFARNNIYYVDPTTPEPVLIDWMDNATKEVFDTINLECCESHVGGYRPEKNELWFSWAAGNDCKPNRSIVFNLKYKTAHIIDAGFTAFGGYRADSRPTFRDLLESLCACDSEDLAPYIIKEGLGCNSLTCPTTLTHVYSDQPLVIEDPDEPEEPIVTEDWDAPESSDNSFCDAIGGARLMDYCGECNEKQLFIGAASEDDCLKEITEDAYLREIAQDLTSYMPTPDDDDVFSFAPPSDGNHVPTGYDSEMVLGPWLLGESELSDVNLKRIVMHIEQQVIEGRINALVLRVGKSNFPVDPRNQNCGITWGPELPKVIECQNEMSPEQYNAKGYRPSNDLNWELYETAKFLYLEIKVRGLVAQGDATGGFAPAIGGNVKVLGIEAFFQDRKGSF